MDLSILIPSRNEMFLARTIQDILEHAESDFEIIAVMDGQWVDPPVPQHERVSVLYFPESIGQRAATNAAARVASGKYLIKCDAHCAFDQGFDVKLMADMQPDWTMLPIMRNLHAFDWVCPNGHRRYQGPSGPCTECGEPTVRDVLWRAKPSPQSTAYRFDTELHFQYFQEFAKREGYELGLIKGYNLSFDTRSISFRVVELLANLTSSHLLTSSRDDLWLRKNMSSNAVGFSPIDSSGGIRSNAGFAIRDEPEVEGIATSPVVACVVNDRDVFPSSTRNWPDNPSINDTVYEGFLTEIGSPSISGTVKSPLPIPTTGDSINSDIIDKINKLIGGKFSYSEKTRSFHNGSVTLQPVYDNMLSESLSIQGSFFMVTREKYFELGLCDEAHGSWGQQGVEVACKTHLSGGKVVVSRKTWYAHMFRTQGGDFSFPYPNPGINKAREYSRNLWLNNKWEKQIYPLSWLIEKFAPIPDWHDDSGKETLERVVNAGKAFYASRSSDDAKDKFGGSLHKPVPRQSKSVSKGIVYYTDNRLDPIIMQACQKQLVTAAGDHRIVSVSLQKIDFGDNITLQLERGYLTMFKQILTGLEELDSDIAFFCEHDLLYVPEHFLFVPPDRTKIYYNTNVWHLRLSDGFAVYYTAKRTSQLCAYRDVLVEHYRKRVERVEKEGFSRRIGFEPGSHRRAERIDDLQSDVWETEHPNIDIKHNRNLTPARWHPSQFRDQRNCRNWKEAYEIPFWGATDQIVQRILSGAI